MHSTVYDKSSMRFSRISDFEKPFKYDTVHVPGVRIIHRTNITLSKHSRRNSSSFIHIKFFWWPTSLSSISLQMTSSTLGLWTGWYHDMEKFTRFQKVMFQQETSPPLCCHHKTFIGIKKSSFTHYHLKNSKSPPG